MVAIDARSIGFAMVATDARSIGFAIMDASGRTPTVLSMRATASRPIAMRATNSRSIGFATCRAVVPPPKGVAKRGADSRLRAFACRCAATCLLALLFIAPGQRVFAQAGEFARVLVLLPSAQQDAAAWAEISRGVQSAGAHALQVADLPIDPIWAACRSPACAASAARAARLPAMLFTRLARDRLELSCFTRDGRHTVSRMALQQRPLAVVAGDLFRDVQQKLSLGEQALLRVRTRPDGALVYLDGQLVGLTPFERAIAAGHHDLRVVSSGFASEVRSLDTSEGEAETVTLTLPPLMAAASRDPASSARPPSAANFVLGSLLLLASVPTLTSGYNALLDRGQCLRAAADGCEERARFEAKHGVFLAAGALAVIGATYLFIARPFRVTAEVDRNRAGLRVQAEF
jgi:hypothetical protein